MSKVHKIADANDPKGLIRESYRIEGITDAECRTIFLDWAIGVPIGQDSAGAINELLEKYQHDFPEHPMTAVLKAGLGSSSTGRRGGRAGRRKS